MSFSCALCPRWVINSSSQHNIPFPIVLVPGLAKVALLSQLPLPPPLPMGPKLPLCSELPQAPLAPPGTLAAGLEWKGSEVEGLGAWRATGSFDVTKAQSDLY